MDVTKLRGRKVTFTGWLFFDAQHSPSARNTNPRGTHNWRATCWEIHPVTEMAVLPTSTVWLRPPFPPKTYPPNRWLIELEQGAIDRDEYRSLVAGQRDLDSRAWRRGAL